MTTLYRPVLIESAEQAEALPVGTLARHSEGAGMSHAHKVEALGHQVWIGDRTNYYNDHMVGWTALVPIGAEEVTARDISPEVGAYGPDDVIPEHYLGPPRTRFVTP